MNEDEPPHLCAVREVLEETGYDMSAKIDPDEYILKEISGQRCCLYMVRNSHSYILFVKMFHRRWPKLFHAFLVFPFTDGKVSKVDVLVIHFVSNDNGFDYQGDFLKDDPCG